MVFLRCDHLGFISTFSRAIRNIVCSNTFHAISHSFPDGAGTRSLRDEGIHRPLNQDATDNWTTESLGLGTIFSYALSEAI